MVRGALQPQDMYNGVRKMTLKKIRPLCINCSRIKVIFFINLEQDKINNYKP